MRSLSRGRIPIEALEPRRLLTRLLGIDVSGNQSPITTAEWTSAKNGGYIFAWTKATEGFTFNDSTFANNEATAKAAGVLIGAYHFARYDNQQGISGADSEAAHFWSIAQNYIKNGATYLVPMLDLEGVPGKDANGNPTTFNPDHFGYTKTTFSQWANEWLTDIKNDAAAVGVNMTPIIYTGVSFASTFLDSTISQSWPLWMANYNSQPAQTGAPSGTSPWQSGAWQFWQYTDAQSVPGIGSSDGDVFKGSASDLNQYIIGSGNRWALGNRVTTTTTVDAWATSAANTTFTAVSSGVTGTIINAQPNFGNSYWRWDVQFDNGTTGWSGEEFMTSATPTAPTASNPANNAVTDSLPTSFSWTGATNASSYKVYLDGVLKTTTTSASWSHPAIADGAHTWRVDAINSELTTTGTTWNFTIDTVAPTASYGGQTPTAGASTMDFTVTYTDTLSGVNTSTIDGSDITVTGPGNYTANASFVSATPSSPRTVTYRITAPGGTWNLSDNGSYTVTQNANQVKDVAGNARASGTIGTFIASIPFAWTSGSALTVEYDDSGTSIALGTDGSNITATKGSTTLEFPGINSIVVSGTSSADTVNFNGPITAPVTLNLGAGADVLNVNSGTFTFNNDASAGTSALTINNSGAVAFNTTQHLSALNLTGGTATLAAGHNKVIVLDTISATGNGALDLMDNDLIANAMTPAAFSTLLDSGYMNGQWNGTGITSSVAAANNSTIGYGLASDIFPSLPATLDGQTITNPNTIIARWTVQGDSNLDGVVNTIDFTAFAQNFSSTSGNDSFGQGDFNYDGVVNALDFNALATNFGSQVSPAASSPVPLSATLPDLFSDTSFQSMSKDDLLM